MTDKKKSDKDKIIEVALKRFRSIVDNQTEMRAEALEDLNFVNGEHWDARTKAQRDNAFRPCLVINKLPSFINKQVNECRMNRPEMRARPVDDGIDKDTAEITNGLLRSIVYGGSVDSAYDTAADFAISCGFGWLRVRTDYDEENSFDQIIIVDRIPNTFQVYAPLHLCQKADCSDMPHGFIVTEIPREEFERKHPDVDMSNWEANANGDNAGWWTEQMVRVAEYYTLDKEKKTLYLLKDGTTTTDKPENETLIEKQRETDITTVKWYKMTGCDILDEEVLPTSRLKCIPLIPVLGKEMNIEGKRSYISLTRWARDPQRMYDYWRSCETEMIALAPKTKVIGIEGQFKGKENQWQNINATPQSYVEYVDVTLPDGTHAPAPRFLENPSIPTAYVNAALEASEDIKSVTGIFDASLGSSGNEKSGVAIKERKAQTDISNFHFVDNLNRAIMQVCRICIDWIPNIYDTERTVRIVGEDKREKVVKINGEYQDAETGKTKLYSMKAGKYDIVADVGSSYATRRQETAEALNELIRVYPAAAPALADLMVEHLDFAGAQLASDRLKKIAPPGVIDNKDDEQKIDPRQMEALMKENEDIKQVVQQLDGTVQKMQAEIDDKDKERQLKMDMAILSSETTIAVAQAKVTPPDPNMLQAVVLDILALKGLIPAEEVPQSNNTPEQVSGPAPMEPNPAPAPTPMVDELGV